MFLFMVFCTCFKDKIANLIYPTTNNISLFFLRFFFCCSAPASSKVIFSLFCFGFCLSCQRLVWPSVIYLCTNIQRSFSWASSLLQRGLHQSSMGMEEEEVIMLVSRTYKSEGKEWGWPEISLVLLIFCPRLCYILWPRVPLV